MDVINLDTHELRDLYRHALYEAYRAEMQGLSLFSWIADSAGNRDLLRLSLAEVDQCRHNLDRLDEVIASADVKLSREAAVGQPQPFDSALFEARRFTSARVRDLAMLMSAQGISNYRGVRYKALVDIAEKLDSGERLDGLCQALKAIGRGEAQMVRIQENL